MVHSFDEIDQLAVNTIRTLSMDAIERADSGHPGAPMGLAPVAYLLFTRFLKHRPDRPDWPDRDRFVLSCGHASMLLYSSLHLTGYDLGLDQIERFRQWGSQTPGHPEVGVVPGAEMTTGPLGQGCSTSVGMAVAEAHLGARFNRPDHQVVDHRTWVLCSDGDLMEGVSAEAASLAGHLCLGKLVWIWDDNRITIEGSTELAFTEDVCARFRAYGWRVLEVDDVNDLGALAARLEEAAASDGRPTLVRVRSHIGWGSPAKQDTPGAHGAPLGADEIRATKKVYGWPEDEEFRVPSAVRDRCREALARGAENEEKWRERVAAWSEAHPALARDWERRVNRRLPDAWIDALPEFPVDGPKMATRAASGKVLNAIAVDLPELIGGSADLAPSCKTLIAGEDSFSAAAPGGRNLHFGIREHAMGAVLNGLVLHGGLRPFGSTFLVFSDYMRPAIRLAALMELPVVYVFTHDSVWVGEDGPTHQPVEHLAALRTIPDLVVLRPADANETSAAWQIAIERADGPTALVLSRQGLPVLAAPGAREGVARGAYVVADAQQPRLVLIATGSEVSLALGAGSVLAEKGVPTRVVSMPSWELFAEQSGDYRERVLPQGVPRLAVEAGVALGWRQWVGDDGAVISIDRFGASAPGAEVAEELGMHVEAVVAKALQILGEKR
ncbi:MAG: transketolase [Thermoanaerobaculales bacterium]